MPKEGEDILEEEALVFKPSLWIGRHKKYKDVPLHVCNALTHLRQIPHRFQSSFPSPELPVLDFINLQLPIQSAELITTKIEHVFSFDAPQMDVQAFLRRSIPPIAFIDKVEKEVGQAWFDGKVAIVDPRFSNSNNTLPFWALTYWRQMSKIIKAQHDWMDARAWIQTEVTKSSISHPLLLEHELLTTCGWNVPLPRTVTMVPGMTTHTLSQFLSNRWLDQEAMDLMISHLQKRLRQDGIRSKKVMIASCQFFSVLYDAAKTNRYSNEAIFSSLWNIEARVKEGLRYLYIPVFGNHHEIAAYVDFDLRKIGYG